MDDDDQIEIRLRWCLAPLTAPASRCFVDMSSWTEAEIAAFKGQLALLDTEEERIRLVERIRLGVDEKGGSKE